MNPDWFEFGVMIGTLILAIVTAWSTWEARNKEKRDRIAKEMDYLIVPLKDVYDAIDSQGGIDSKWWFLYTAQLGGPFSTIDKDREQAREFRETIKKIEKYKYLAPEKLYNKIYTFLLRLNEMKRSQDAEFRECLRIATDDLFGKVKRGEFYVKGGLVEERYYELTKELNQGIKSKLLNRFPRLRRKKPPSLMIPFSTI